MRATLPASTALLTPPNGVRRLVTPLPRYARADPGNLPAMRLTDRDRHILEAVHAHEGLLSETQIRSLFFSGRSATQTRLMLLYQHGYLNRPDRRQRAALTQMVYWLGERGAAVVAGLSGQTLSDYPYRREPRWSQIEHDLAVNDVRIAVTQACAREAGFTLLDWQPEGEFHAQPDRVRYPLPNGSTATRQIIPDGYCQIERAGRLFHFLWEIDKRTEDNPRFAREKVLPGIAYLATPAYQARFGASSGQWLIVTTGARRLQNLKRQTEHAAREQARHFYFTTLAQLTPAAVLSAPIWYRGGDSQPLALFKPHDVRQTVVFGRFAARTP